MEQGRQPHATPSGTTGSAAQSLVSKQTAVCSRWAACNATAFSRKPFASRRSTERSLRAAFNATASSRKPFARKRARRNARKQAALPCCSLGTALKATASYRARALGCIRRYRVSSKCRGHMKRTTTQRDSAGRHRYRASRAFGNALARRAFDGGGSYSSDQDYWVKRHACYWVKRHACDSICLGLQLVGM
jgi:hypothetical protein